MSKAVIGVLALGAPAALAAKANPLGEVLSLLGDLESKVQKEGEAEAKAYKEYFEWCDDVAKNGQFEIKTSASQKESLEATIAEKSANIEASTSKISDLASAIAATEADLTGATGIREKESSDFAASEKELVDVIDTLGRAITVIEREMQKNPAALAQMNVKGYQGLLDSLNAVVDAAAFSAVDKKRLAALVQSQQSSDEDDAEFGAPAAATYKTHSTSIVDTLEDLKEKAEGQLSDLRKAEVAAKHNYEMLKQSLEDQMGADNKDMAGEKKSLAGSEETKAVATGDLAVATSDLSKAKEALATAGSQCMNVAADHEATVAARTEELKVIDKAKVCTPGELEGLYREFRFLSEFVSHPHVARCLGMMHSPARVYLILEFAGNQNLSQILQARPGQRLDEEDALHCFDQIVQGLTHCHSVNVCHRNLSLEHVVLMQLPCNEKYRCCIVDFHSAMVSRGQTTSRTVCGTLPCMAPEMAMGGPYVPRLADCWSAGVLLLEMAGGISALSRSVPYDPATAESRQVAPAIQNYFVMQGSHARALAFIGAVQSNLIVAKLQALIHPNPEGRSQLRDVLQNA